MTNLSSPFLPDRAANFSKNFWPCRVEVEVADDLHAKPFFGSLILGLFRDM